MYMKFSQSKYNFFLSSKHYDHNSLNCSQPKRTLVPHSKLGQMFLVVSG